MKRGLRRMDSTNEYAVQRDKNGAVVAVGNFAIGQRVKLDRRVPGKVDGFYVNDDDAYVIFKPDWKPGIAVWGTLVCETPTGENLKLASFGLIVVHPGNLTIEDD